MTYQLSMSICCLTRSEKSNRVTFNLAIYWDWFFCFVLLSVISFHSVAVSPNPVLCIIAQGWMIWFWTCLLTIIHADVVTVWTFHVQNDELDIFWVCIFELHTMTSQQKLVVKYSANLLVSVCLESPHTVIRVIKTSHVPLAYSFCQFLGTSWLVSPKSFGLFLNAPNEVRPSQMSAAWLIYVLWFDFQFHIIQNIFRQYKCN